MRGARATAPYGRDGRSGSLTEAIASVVRSEFDGTITEPKLRALVRYVSDRDFLPNRNLDLENRLTAESPDAARAGAPVFEKHCARCHIPTAMFRDGLVHRHGTKRRASPYSLDDGIETPTLLGLAETAPYFHDGRFRTIDEVVRWYDRTLGLEDSERGALVAFVEAVGAVNQPHDVRPESLRRAERYAYLLLLESGPYARDEAVCAMAIARAIEVTLDEQAKQKLVAHAARCGSRMPDIRKTFDDLLRLAALIESGK